MVIKWNSDKEEELGVLYKGSERKDERWTIVSVGKTNVFLLSFSIPLAA